MSGETPSWRIHQFTTPLAWAGVGLSTAIGVMTIRTTPEITALSAATGVAWLALAWYVSRDARDADAAEPVQGVATDGGEVAVEGEDGGDHSEEGVGRTYLKRCPDCSWTISITDYYCRHCGTRVREEQTTTQHTETLS